MNNKFNYNTYISLNPLTNRLAHSISRSNSGKYHLSKKEKKNNEYFIIKDNNITLLVPFSALFSTNNKLDGIPGLNFSSSIYCPSRRLNLCQLKDNSICYALRGQIRSGGISHGLYSKKGFIKMNSFYSDQLTELFLKICKKEKKVLNNFINYINNNIKLIRFNKGGDFKTRYDVLFLEYLAMSCPGTVFYGYTARDDLNINFISKNIYLNGSNKLYTNRFKATNDIKKYVTYKYSCAGYCLNCCKCWTLKNKTILCFIHGAKKDVNTLIKLNDNNIKFLTSILKVLNINIDLKNSNDILKDFYKPLIKIGAPAPIKNQTKIKDIVFILNNIDLLNITKNQIEKINKIIFEDVKK